jgi:hypothetical protein
MTSAWQYCNTKSETLTDQRLDQHHLVVRLIHLRIYRKLLLRVLNRNKQLESYRLRKFSIRVACNVIVMDGCIYLQN